MTQDFAKIRPEPILERKSLRAPPAWLFMLTGIVVGVAIGVFACVLLYLSGAVPPLTAATTPVATEQPARQSPQEEPRSQDGLVLEFYHELPSYEVPVEATPVELTAQQSGAAMPVNYLLQSGAFRQRELADLELQRQRALGLEVFLKSEQLSGNTLFLVQSGPYTDSRTLRQAEQSLRRNNINTMRLKVEPGASP